MPKATIFSLKLVIKSVISCESEGDVYPRHQQHEHFCKFFYEISIAKY